MKRVGIYSGTFDPVHIGHLAFADQAARECGLEKVFFLTEPRPRRKQAVKALSHRVAMIARAIEDNPRFGNIVIDQAQFTIPETMPVLQARFPGAELSILMGEDVIEHLVDWPQVNDLFKNMRLVIGVRSGSLETVASALQTLRNSRGLEVKYEIIGAPASEVTSSAIRRKLAKNEFVDELPAKVYDYITQKGLYSSTAVNRTTE